MRIYPENSHEFMKDFL